MTWLSSSRASQYRERHLSLVPVLLPRNSANQIIGFPDTATWKASGTSLSIEDWRRANIDKFVERMYREVHVAKPTLKVGISPFGIWRPGNPLGVNGLDVRDHLRRLA